MADTVEITELRVAGQAAEFAVQFGGDPTAKAMTWIEIYDSTESLVKHEVLYEAPLSQANAHGGSYDLPAAQLDDGDYTVWLRCQLQAADGADGMPGMLLKDASAGVSFLVGRHHVYPSGEQAHERDGTTSVELANLRLEGTWVVFDMVNSAAHDVSVDHELGVWDGSSYVHNATGRELVNQKATQQGHHLLPEQLADGTYSIQVTAQVEGANGIRFAEIDVESYGGALTVVP